MIKIFKNYVLIVFIALAFSFSQIVSINANCLKINSQKGEGFVTEQRGKNATNIATLYATSLNYGVENEAFIEGKFENVIERITIGNFGIGMIIGYASTTVGMLLGWMISKIVMLIKSSR